MKYEEEHRRKAEEISSQIEVLRAQGEDHQARLDEETRRRREEKRRKQNESQRAERIRTEESQGNRPPSLSPERDSSYYARPNRTPSPQPFYAGSFGYPAPNSYLYPGYPTSPYALPSPVPSMSNITGSAISFGSMPAHVSNYNSGNVSNTVITNSMNNRPS